jgi:hypothetical protein
MAAKSKAREELDSMAIAAAEAVCLKEVAR